MPRIFADDADEEEIWPRIFADDTDKKLFIQIRVIREDPWLRSNAVFVLRFVVHFFFHVSSCDLVVPVSFANEKENHETHEAHEENLGIR